MKKMKNQNTLGYDVVELVDKIPSYIGRSIDMKSRKTTQIHASNELKNSITIRFYCSHVLKNLMLQ
jgi:hypothetical protein